MQRLLVRSAKVLFRHDTTRGMDQVHQLNALTSGPASGSPLIIMVQSTQDWTSDNLIPCILKGMNRPDPFRDLLSNPLMRSCLVEVGYIGIQHALEMLLVEDEVMVQAFLPHTP